jgi:hypothetical protein
MCSRVTGGLPSAAAGVVISTPALHCCSGLALLPRRPRSHRSRPQHSDINPPSGGVAAYTLHARPDSGACVACVASDGCLPGYQASGPDSRFAQAVITVPGTPRRPRTRE